MARPKSSSTGWWVGLALVIALAGAGLYAVLSLRFSGGEAYPAYSTLRADPLGARAIYEALGRLPGIRSERNFERLKKLGGGPRDTLMLLNVDAQTFNRDGDAIDGGVVARWAAGGGRVVIALDSKVSPGGFSGWIDGAVREAEEEERARRGDAKKEETGESGKEAKKPATKPAPGGREKTPGTRRKDSKEGGEKKAAEEFALAEALKLSATAREFALRRDGGAELTPTPEMPLNPADLPRWFSNVFLNADPKQDWRLIPASGWKPAAPRKKGSPGGAESAGEPGPTDGEPSPWRLLAHRGGRAMIMERSLGAGSVVVCTDSFFASNEALWAGAHARFLAWLVGDARRVIFDETHLGSSIGDEDSLMTLARRYRMHGLFIGGVVLFLLYVWRNAMSLVPRDEARDLGQWRQDAVAGQSATTGLEGLLSRGIPRRQVLSRCLETWEATPAAARSVPADRLAKARAALAAAPGLKQAAATYQKLRDILHPPRH